MLFLIIFKGTHLREASKIQLASQNFGLIMYYMRVIQIIYNINR